MTFKCMTRIAVALLLIAVTGLAHAKMTPRPSDKDGRACLKWALAQAKDVQKSWGKADDGAWSDKEATFRLLIYCLTGEVPVTVH